MQAHSTTPSRAQPRSNRLSHGAMRDLRAQAVVMKQDARRLAESAGELAREQMGPLREYVAEKPIQTVLIATGIGLILGVLFSRR